MFLVMAMKKDITLEVLGGEVPLSLKDLADGCVGAVLVFDDYEAASRYAQGNQIVEVKFKE